MSAEEGQDKMAQKRAMVMGDNKKKTNFMVMVVALVVTVAATYLFLGKEKDVPAGTRPQTVNAPAGTEGAPRGEIAHALGEVSDGKAHFYHYQAPEGFKISYFLVKDRGGKVRSAFDACDACWPAGKGYTQDGDVMVCNNCRMRFPLEKVGDVKGGCNPSPLATRVEGDRVVVKTADILAGGHYFDPAKK